MCIFGGSKKQTPPALPPPPPVPATPADQDVQRARSDEQARMRALAGSGSTVLTAGKDLTMDAGAAKTKLGE